MPRSGNDLLWICIPDLKQRLAFSFKCFRIRNIIADLNINFVASPLRYEINFFLIQLPDIYVKSPSKQFNADHVLICSAIVHIPASQNGIPDPCVAQIKFLCTFQILLSADIVALDIIKDESIAQIPDISANRYVIGRCLIFRQDLTDLIGRSQITDIVHKELAQLLQNQCVRQSIFLYKIPCDDRFINLLNVLDSVCFCSVNIRSSQPSLYGILVKKLIFIVSSIIILAVLAKAKGKYMDLDIASGEQSCQIRA